MPVDNEPKHGAWQSRFAAIWQKRQPTSMKKEPPTEILRLPDGRNALMDYYVYREIIEGLCISLFEPIFWDSRACVIGVNLGKGCFEKLQQLVLQQEQRI
jgi:hypothetical protein